MLLNMYAFKNFFSLPFVVYLLLLFSRLYLFRTGGAIRGLLVHAILALGTKRIINLTNTRAVVELILFPLTSPALSSAFSVYGQLNKAHFIWEIF